MVNTEALGNRTINHVSFALPRMSTSLSSVVYMCAQSLFKLHPDFDLAVKGVLEASGSNHLVFTAGRRQQWTSIFQARLTSTLGDDFMTRVRCSCHTFPFGTK